MAINWMARGAAATFGLVFLLWFLLLHLPPV
jgi:hypothetical protein